jgi:sulfatase modifying factor 1
MRTPEAYCSKRSSPGKKTSMTCQKMSVKSRLALSPLVGIPAGLSRMGSDEHYPEEGPAHFTRVESFRIEQMPVTNRQFRNFIRETRYKTVAERPLDPKQFPDLSEQERGPGSLVFVPTSGPVDLRHFSQWWRWVPGACWKHPEGPNSSIKGREDHPVVHIAYEDAQAYANWCGRDLPTEAQWEYAARGGLDGKTYCWGDEAKPNGTRMAKYYEGAFPWHNAASDGHLRTAPVCTYPANGFGLYDMAGNVWEWTIDWYADRHEAESACCTSSNPRIDRMEGSLDPAQPQFRIPRRVLKGGSFLCADEYCHRYRPAARRPQMIDTGMSHIGFRCVQL